MNRMRAFYLTVSLAAAALCGCGTQSVWQRQTFALDLPAGPDSAPSGTNLVALGRVTIAPLFQSRSFTYRTGQDSYEQDPYASFLISPESAVAEPIRARMEQDGTLGRLIGPDSQLHPSIVVEAAVNELDGDFRNASHPVAEMTIHFIIYETGPDGPGNVLLDHVFAEQTPLSNRTAAALVAGWDEALRKIMEELNSEYAKAHPHDR
jgi:ABC-type uncharacterized transport system auxiliary subunit